MEIFCAFSLSYCKMPTINRFLSEKKDFPAIRRGDALQIALICRKDEELQALGQRRLSVSLAVLAALGLLLGCEQKNQYVAPPLPTVTVSRPLQKEVLEYLEFTGTTQSIASVDVRARVQGVLQNIYFQDGGMVKKGDLLCIIEPSSYKAAVDKAAADLESKKAQLEKAEIEYQRNQRLYKENAASERDLVNSKAARDSAKAAVAISEAALDDAKISLGYTTVYAPLSGRIARRQVDVGNLVGAGEYTLLTTIKQYDPMYVYFTLNEHQLLKLRKMQRKGKGQVNEEKLSDIPLYLGLANEDGFPHEGRLDYADLGVDPGTGTILMRGIFPNPPPYVILPGLFARIRLPIGKTDNALLVSERALGSDQLGDYLLLVNSENVVEHRTVKTGTLVDGMRVVTEGLKSDEWVVVNGLQRARPGAKVNPSRVEASTHPAVGG